MPETLLPEPAMLLGLAMALSLVLAATLVLMRLRYPADIRGAGLWALGPTLWCLASALIGQHGRWPIGLTQGGGSLLVATGALVYYLGVRDFYRRPTRWPGYALLALLLLALFPLEQDPRADTAYLLRVCAVYMAIDALNLRVLLRHGNRRFPVRLIQAAFLVHLLALAARFVRLTQGSGFHDYLVPSPFNSLYVGAYVFALLALGMGAIAMAMERLSGDLRQQATHDPLTQVLHRGALLQACARELERSRRTGRGPTLLMFDLDHFKAVNDTLGHPHGDLVLAHCARRAQEQLRPADLLGRYGGEEFMVLLPETHLSEAEGMAQHIRAAVSAVHPLNCTVSIGAAAWRGPQDTLDAMIARADRALYQAKSQGRNRTCAA